MNPDGSSSSFPPIGPLIGSETYTMCYLENGCLGPKKSDTHAQVGVAHREKCQVGVLSCLVSQRGDLLLNALRSKVDSGLNP